MLPLVHALGGTTEIKVMRAMEMAASEKGVRKKSVSAENFWFIHPSLALYDLSAISCPLQVISFLISCQHPKFIILQWNRFFFSFKTNSQFSLFKVKIFEVFLACLSFFFILWQTIICYLGLNLSEFGLLKYFPNCSHKLWLFLKLIQQRLTNLCFKTTGELSLLSNIQWISLIS